MTSVQDRLVALVSTAPHARKDVDVEIAVPWLKKKSELLQSLEKDTLKDVIRNCGYQKAAKDDIIISQGDIGDCFYIMLTGKTSVYIDTVRTDEDPATAAPRDNNQSSNLDHNTKESDNSDGDETDTNQEKRKPLNRSHFGKLIMHFEAGQSFGEIALISDNCVRNATIIADMESDLLVIHKDLFNTYMKASQVAEYEEKRDFVDRCSLFHGWNAKFRNLLEMSLRKEVYPYGSVIIQQGAPVTGLIFILSGQAKLMMEPSRHECQFKEIMRKKDVIPQRNKKKQTSIKEEHPHKNQRDSVTSAQIDVRRKFGYAAAERRIMSRTVDICCIEKDEIIGDVEMVLDLETNSESVVSTALTTVLILNQKNYERLVAKKHAFTIARLTQWAYNKISTRSKTSKGNLIPLFRFLQAELKERLPRPPPPVKRVEILKKREMDMKQLLDMFMEDKAPLIEPCVPNSLFYRQRAAQKNKALMQNPYAQLRMLRHIDDFGKIRRKVPRSIQQLKNNIKAERELLGDDRREVVDPSAELFLALSRPVTSVGFGRQSKVSTARSQRPKSAISQSLRVTECGQAEAGFGASASHPDNNYRLDLKAVAEIYEDMEQVNRDNQEMRMRLICSASAKNELREKLERSKSPIDTSEYGGLYEGEDYDWETSETNLRDLESRVADFCRSVTPSRPMSGMSRPGTAGQAKSGLPGVTEMRRFEIDDPSAVPLPGGTVFVHKKPCRFPKTVPVSSNVHRHVRRFILSKEPTIWNGVTPAATMINY